jgi:hypothetical protein
VCYYIIQLEINNRGAPSDLAGTPVLAPHELLLNFCRAIADIIHTISSLGKNCGKMTDNVQEIDTVLQLVRQTAQRYCAPSETAITQQILLLGDSFYGYRFTTMDFTAIWSAADQTLKVFDQEGRAIEFCSPLESIEPVSLPQRKVA